MCNMSRLQFLLRECCEKLYFRFKSRNPGGENAIRKCGQIVHKLLQSLTILV